MQGEQWLRRARSRAAATACGFFISVSVAFGADFQPPGEPGGVAGPLLELLVQKKLITRQDADGLRGVSGPGRGDDFAAIVELLQERGAITSDDAVALLGRRQLIQENVAAAPVSGSLVMPEDDALLVDQLRRQWVGAGNDPDDFPAMLGEPADIGLAITKLRAMGVLPPEDASRLESRYRRNHLTGVVQTALDQREQVYAGHLRKDLQVGINNEVKEAVEHQAKANPLPDWARRFRVSGDLRIRYEGAFFADNNYIPVNPATGAVMYNTNVDRNRFLMRARLAVNASVTNEVEAGVRLATGNLNNPVTNNQTMGNYENKYTTVMDLAYLKWTPNENWTFWGGRIPNPFFCTDLVWSPNLTFDGIVAEASSRLTQSMGGFFTIGVLPLQEFEYSGKDKWLFAGQAGIHYQPDKNINAKAGIAYYYFNNVKGEYTTLGSTNTTLPGYIQKGNSYFDADPTTGYALALASDYHELNVTASVDLGLWEPYHFVLIGDYVRNLGFNLDQARMKSGDPAMERSVNGFQLGAVFGYPNLDSFGTWRSFLFYKYLGADAVLDAFTDSDFNLGGTNAKGWILGGELGLSKNLWLKLRWLSSNEISGPPLGVDLLQFDLNGKF